MASNRSKRHRELFVICHNIRSRENVGSVFRTGDAFGVDKIYLTGYTPAPPHPKISKTALGAEEWISWEHKKSITALFKKLKQGHIRITALEQVKKRSITLPKFKPRFPLALILGNEVEGLPRSILDKTDEILEIPMSGRKESLNVAVAFGIAAYHIRLGRG